MKKFIAMLVAIMLVACILPAAYAEESDLIPSDDYELQVGSAEVTTGEGFTEVTLEVSVAKNAIAAFNIGQLKAYATVKNEETGENETVYAELVKVEAYGGGAAIPNLASGQIAYIHYEDVSGLVLKVTFKVPVSEDITFTVGSASGNAANPADSNVKYTMAVLPGTIQVGTPAPHVCNFKLVETKAATCTEAGYELYKCECGNEDKKVLNALGHDPKVVEGYAATCTKTGLTDGEVCARCGEVLKKQEVIAKIPHTVEVITGYAATCTKTGLTDGEKCSVCGEILKAQEEIAMLPHTWGADVAVGPYDCDKGSETTHTCSVCGATEAGAKIEPHKHVEYAVPQGDSYEKDGKIYQDYIDYCRHGDKDNKDAHGCTYESAKYAKEIGEEPPMGDITPYITMGVVTVVALISAAAYLILKRKAI